MSPITISLPADTQLSNPPMSGLFRIKCALDEAGTAWNQTQPIEQTTNWPGDLKNKIIQSCPMYRDKIEVYTGNSYYYEDGRDTLIRFVGLNYDVPQFELVNDPINPLQGVNL